LEQNTKKHDEEDQAEYEEEHKDVAHEKEDMGLKEIEKPRTAALLHSSGVAATCVGRLKSSRWR
jgi:hypothetical protein